jgi:hypothetical protein
MKKLTLVLVFVSSIAFAHVEPGTYRGMTPEGKECSMSAGATYFENNVRHPLNERIDVSAGGADFKVGHPPIVDAGQSVAFFNHDLFQGVLPTSTGAQALVIEMSHEANGERAEGPRSFTLIENHWKSGEKSALVCGSLKLSK